MEYNKNIKKQIIEMLASELDEKIMRLKQSVKTLTEARNNEDKCTVGDKYETGRAMTQMELEKNQAQLSKTEAFRTQLAKIDVDKICDTVEFGSLISTSQDLYFFALPFGKIEVEGTSVFCLSLASPIGQALVGKCVGESLVFQGRTMEVLEIH